eukprot:scaffold26622_cov43-Phaeocystis_antarctica.AAC.2
MLPLGQLSVCASSSRSPSRLSREVGRFTVAPKPRGSFSRGAAQPESQRAHGSCALGARAH